MNILLLGYGKMGKVIEQIALSRGHQIVGKIDVNNRHELTTFNRGNVDVVIGNWPKPPETTCLRSGPSLPCS